MPLGRVCGAQHDTFDPKIITKLDSDVKFKTEVPMFGVGDMNSLDHTTEEEQNSMY